MSQNVGKLECRIELVKKKRILFSLFTSFYSARSLKKYVTSLRHMTRRQPVFTLTPKAVFLVKRQYILIL